jgi:hypothetical protein
MLADSEACSPPRVSLSHDEITSRSDRISSRAGSRDGWLGVWSSTLAWDMENQPSEFEVLQFMKRMTASFGPCKKFPAG